MFLRENLNAESPGSELRRPPLPRTTLWRNEGPMSNRSPVTLVLVHGAWHGGWAWDHLMPFLSAAGLRTHAVQLPGVGRGAGRDDLVGHSEYLEAELAAIPGPVVLCGHSYGGAVITQASAAASNVVALIYVAGFMLDVGESCADVNRWSPAPAQRHRGAWRSGSYVHVSADYALSMFYGGCSPEQAAAAAARLTPEHVGTLTTAATSAGWRDIRSTYVLCKADAAIPVETQRAMAHRATCQVELESAHSPMLSQPEELSHLIVRALEERTRRS